MDMTPGFVRGDSVEEYIEIEGEDEGNDYDEVPNFGMSSYQDGYDSGAINNSR